MARELQHLALDHNGDIIDVANTEGRETERFFCPNCKEKVIAKRGEIRQWHFAHKKKNCAYDKYLHSIAEKMIGEWFNEQKEILLDMVGTKICTNHQNCVFYNEWNCKGECRNTYNLKQYYSDCILEHKYKGFVADLFCERNNNTENPIFIEIFVTHKCSEEKINSGIRIIEIAIKSEEDIFNITKSSTLLEGENIRLYNFKRQKTLSNEYHTPVQKYILFNSGKGYLDRNNYHCKNYKERKGIYEISISYNDCIPYFIFSGGFYKVCVAKAYKEGLVKKDCNICKWCKQDTAGYSFCVLYKKCGNPKYCMDNDAQKCTMFREDISFITEAAKELDEYIRTNGGDIWINHKYKNQKE